MTDIVRGNEISPLLESLEAIDNFFAEIRTSTKQAIDEPIPNKFIKDRKAKGGGNWKYAKIDYFEDWLNKHYPGWSADTLREWTMGSGRNQFIVCVVQVTVYQKGLKRTISRTGGAEVKYYGDEHPRKGDFLDIGNDYKAAETDGLKRCCYTLGAGRELKYDPADIDITEEDYGYFRWLIEKTSDRYKEKMEEYIYKNATRANFESIITDVIYPMLVKAVENGREDLKVYVDDVVQRYKLNLKL